MARSYLSLAVGAAFLMFCLVGRSVSAAPITSVEGQYDIFWPNATIRPPYPVVAYIYPFFSEFPTPENGLAGTELRKWLANFAVRRGYVVIMPRYQQGTAISTWQMTAERQLREALARCGTRIDRNRFALVGYSLGGMIALKMADRRPRDIPLPKAIILHDGAGLDYSPLLATPTSQVAAGWNTTSYEKFPNLAATSNVSTSTQLLALVAKGSFWNAYLEGVFPPAEIEFANSNALGLMCRAWWNTPSSLRKKFLLVQDNPEHDETSEHTGPITPGYREAYWKHTEDMLAAAFARREYVPDLRHEYPAYLGGRTRTVTAFTGMPRPVAYAWNCSPGLSSEQIDALDSFSEVASRTFTETPELTAALHNVFFHVFAPLGIAIESGEMPALHVGDMLRLLRAGLYVVPPADRDAVWMTLMGEAEIFLDHLPCGE